MRRFEEAEQIANKLLESSSKPREANADYLFLVAMLDCAHGDHEKAITLLEKAISVARRRYHCVYMGALVETCTLMGDRDNSIGWYRKAIESERHSSPYMIQFHYRLGLLHEEKKEFRAIVGEYYVLIEKEDVIVYEQDGSIFQVMPEIVVLFANVEQVSAVIKAAKRANVPIVLRGSGTGLAGGAVPAEGGIVLSLARLDRILKIDLPNRIAIVEPGVINQDVTKAVAKDGFFYAPDPSSQAACSICGIVANNSGCMLNL